MQPIHPPHAPHKKTSPATAASPPKNSTPIAAVCLGAQASDEADEAAVPTAAVPFVTALVPEATLPVAVAEAESADPLVDAAVPVPVALATAAVEQLAVDWTLTPLAAHICWAKEMAACWSSASQAERRQHDMVPMKAGSAQMHFGSVPQLP